MNTLFVATLASLAAFTVAAPSGLHGAGAVVTGPAGIVTSAGPIGPAGHGAGLGWGHGAVLAAPAIAAPLALAAPAVVAGPALGLGHGLALGHGLGAITPGGGTIGVSAHGAAIRGPPTAPVVVAGPAGKITADGLWGPTANVGLTGGHGAWAGAAHGAWGGAHGAWGHGW